MNDLTDLYQDVILDHGKNPRNRRRIDDATHAAEGFNPLCGDRVNIYLSVHHDTIDDVSFEGTACAICTASASLMTRKIKGETTAGALADVEQLRSLLMEGDPDAAAMEKAGPLAALAGVRRYPMRVKCATLPWHTLREALGGAARAPVSTE